MNHSVSTVKQEWHLVLMDEKVGPGSLMLSNHKTVV